jgi:hypothetical protein
LKEKSFICIKHTYNTNKIMSSPPSQIPTRTQSQSQSLTYEEIKEKEGVNSRGQPLRGPLNRPPVAEDFPPSFAFMFKNNNQSEPAAEDKKTN